MAEAVGLVASVVALAGAAGTALKMSKALYDLAQSLEAAAYEIEDFALNVKVFGSVMELGYTSLQGAFGREFETPVVEYIKRNILDDLIKQSQHTNERMDIVCRKTEIIQGKVKFITKIKWVLGRKQILSLRPEMQGLKESLNIVISCVALEIALQSQSSESEEIKALKGQIQVQLETITLLRENHDREIQRLQAAGKNITETFSALSPNLQNALIAMAEHLVRYGTPPGPGGDSANSYAINDINAATELEA
ncbi:hypothetical protein BKA65DRAFT_104639 [Rhexocercosporidium sp. MPI-PUGE-AT-0058]|nr:hypothetical protein BKA65DRAFT_104639 [Rhexocercosporidium sp. MPI-PUGE-AT-0058]